jgi:hypothetical protein
MSQWTKTVLEFMKQEERNPETLEIYEHIL